MKSNIKQQDKLESLKNSESETRRSVNLPIFKEHTKAENLHDRNLSASKPGIIEVHSQLDNLESRVANLKDTKDKTIDEQIIELSKELKDIHKDVGRLEENREITSKEAMTFQHKFGSIKDLLTKESAKQVELHKK